MAILIQAIVETTALSTSEHFRVSNWLSYPGMAYQPDSVFQDYIMELSRISRTRDLMHCFRVCGFESIRALFLSRSSTLSLDPLTRVIRIFVGKSDENIGPSNASRGVLCFLIGATLVFDAIKFTLMCPFSFSDRMYSTVAYAGFVRALEILENPGKFLKPWNSLEKPWNFSYEPLEKSHRTLLKK